MAGGYLFIALALLTLVDTDAAPRVNAGEAVGTFLYKITNNARSPTFDVNATLPVVGGPLIRYMEQTVLRDPTQFKSFVVNFTNPYGDFVVSMNGVKDTYYQDGYYWEFFVNTKAIDVGTVPLCASIAHVLANDALNNWTYWTTGHARQPPPKPCRTPYLTENKFAYDGWLKSSETRIHIVNPRMHA